MHLHQLAVATLRSAWVPAMHAVAELRLVAHPIAAHRLAADAAKQHLLAAQHQLAKALFVAC